MRFISLILFVMTTFLSDSLYAKGYVESLIEKYIDQVNNPPNLDLNRIQRGQLIQSLWLDSAVYTYYRTKKDFELLAKSEKKLLADPDDSYAVDSIKNSYWSSFSKVYSQIYQAGANSIKNKKLRSLEKDYLVINGADPVSGCNLVYDTKDEERFYDVCSSRRYDAAGRLFKVLKNGKKVNKPYFNLRVIPYYMQENLLFFGSKDGYESLPKFEIDFTEHYHGKKMSQQLVVAGFYNDKEKIISALKYGANIDYKINKDLTPLVAAVIGSDSEIIKILLKHGCEISKEAISQAKFRKRPDVVSLFFKQLEKKSGD